MRDLYIQPEIKVEELERTDILLGSGDDTPTPASSPKKRELENRYGSFVDFMLGGPSAWF